MLPPLRSTVAPVRVPLTSADAMVNPLEVAVSAEVTLRLVAVTFVNSPVD